MQAQTFYSPLDFARFGNAGDRLYITHTAYCLLASIFNVDKTALTYGEFADAMAEMGFKDDYEAGVLRLESDDGTIQAQSFAYNPTQLPLDLVVTRNVQDAWRDYMEQTYQWTWECFTRY